MKKILLFIAVICMTFCTALAKKPKEPKGLSTRYRSALIFAYSKANSIFEDENIRLEIYNQSLWAINKTQKTIFIDLSQCFLVHNGSSHPMFAAKQDEKSASKKGRTTSIDDFITIAPATGSKQNDTWICDMSVRLYHKYGTAEAPDEEFSDYDKRLLGIIGDLVEESKNADPEKKDYIGTVQRHLTEDESVNNIGASIAYSFNKRSENWTSVSISTWVCDVIFAPYYVELPPELTKEEKKGFEVKGSKPLKIHVRADSPFEFDADRSPITVCDWTGNYKKGTFTLGALIIPYSAYNIKKITIFDGVNADWGKMYSCSNSPWVVDTPRQIK